MTAEIDTTLKPRSHAADIFQRVTRYTRIVFVGKWALGAISALIILTIIIIPLIDQTRGSARISFVSVQKGEGGDTPVMVQPKLQGVTKANEPFTITADRAAQIDPDHVQLYNLQGDLFRTDQSWSGITAKDGLYDSKKSNLTLTGDVTLYQDTGYSFASQRVDIDTANAIAYGDGAITGQGPLGNLQATGYSIKDNGAHMRFGGKGRVTVRIYK